MNKITSLLLLGFALCSTPLITFNAVAAPDVGKVTLQTAPPIVSPNLYVETSPELTKSGLQALVIALKIELPKGLTFDQIFERYNGLENRPIQKRSPDGKLAPLVYRTTILLKAPPAS